MYNIIKIDRQRHNVVISDVNLWADSIVNSNYLELEVEVKNLGTSDEDVKIVIENSELGLYFESEEFELEEFDQDDRERVFMSVNLESLNIEDKEYDILIRAEYDDGDEEDVVVETLDFKRDGDAFSGEFELIDLTGGVVVLGENVIDSDNTQDLSGLGLTGGVIGVNEDTEQSSGWLIWLVVILAIALIVILLIWLIFGVLL